MDPEAEAEGEAVALEAAGVGEEARWRKSIWSTWMRAQEGRGGSVQSRKENRSTPLIWVRGMYGCRSSLGRLLWRWRAHENLIQGQLVWLLKNIRIHAEQIGQLC